MPRKTITISASTYTEPAFIARERERYGDHFASVRAHDALAAARAVQSVLPRDTDLAALLNGADPSAIVTVIAEMERLLKVEDDRLDALATAAWVAAANENGEVGRPLVRLADDAYIAWVGTCDAPTGWVMTTDEARTAGFPVERIRDAEDATGEHGIGNRAGPGEVALTTAALIEAYRSADAHREFRLTPEKVQTSTTSDMKMNDVTGEWETSKPYWKPWAPDAVPATLPSTFKDRF